MTLIYLNWRIVRSTGNFSSASGLWTLTWKKDIDLCKSESGNFEEKKWLKFWPPEIYVSRDRPPVQQSGSPAPQTWGRTQRLWKLWRCGCRWSFSSPPWSASQSALSCPCFPPLVLAGLNSQETAQRDIFHFQNKGKSHELAGFTIKQEHVWSFCIAMKNMGQN